MGTKLLSAVGKSSLGLMLVCCLWVFAVTGSARAAGAFSNPICSVQRLNPGGVVTWQIDGKVSVSGLPANNPFSYTIWFEKKPNGANWIELFQASGTTTADSNGNANLDSGWQNITPPGKGDQYRI